jgi:hypothetical protein
VTAAAVVTAALTLLHPGGEPRAHRARAETVLEVAQFAGVPPLLIVAQVERESRWQPGVLGGRDGQCVGFMQICLHEREPCKGPQGMGFDFESAACGAERVRLQDGAANLRAGARALRAWATLCKRVTGRRAGLANLLSGFGGFDRAGVTCGRRKGRAGWVDVKPPVAVQATLALYHDLVRRKIR